MNGLHRISSKSYFRFNIFFSIVCSLAFMPGAAWSQGQENHEQQQEQKERKVMEKLSQLIVAAYKAVPEEASARLRDLTDFLAGEDQKLKKYLLNKEDPETMSSPYTDFLLNGLEYPENFDNVLNAIRDFEDSYDESAQVSTPVLVAQEQTEEDGTIQLVGQLSLLSGTNQLGLAPVRECSEDYVGDEALPVKGRVQSFPLASEDELNNLLSFGLSLNKAFKTLPSTVDQETGTVIWGREDEERDFLPGGRNNVNGRLTPTEAKEFSQLRGRPLSSLSKQEESRFRDLERKKYGQD